MSTKYHELYQKVMAAARPFKAGDPTRSLKVGVFVKQDSNRQATPSVHIRVLEWLQHPAITKQLDAQFLSLDAFLQDEQHVFDMDVVLVQRNMIKPHLVQPFVSTCQQRNLPIIFELDDDLMHVPSEKDPDGIYARSAPGIAMLAGEATAVIVSTEPLATQMQELNLNVTVIPNALSEFVWLRPIEPAAQVPLEDLQTTDGQMKVLYMGNPTHGEDLAMIRPVFERLQQEGHPVKLFVIGGELEDGQQDWYHRLLIPNEYRHYPEFVNWFRTIAPYCDLAIAPLVESEFNRCKSALKFLQYGAVELPGLYSNCLPYSDVVSDGVDGFLVENTEEAWYNRILHCISSREVLEDLGQAAKLSVLQRHLMTQYVNTYAKVFSKSLRN